MGFQFFCLFVCFWFCWFFFFGLKFVYLSTWVLKGSNCYVNSSSKVKLSNVLN